MSIPVGSRVRLKYALGDGYGIPAPQEGAEGYIMIYFGEDMYDVQLDTHPFRRLVYEDDLELIIVDTMHGDDWIIRR